MGNFKSFVISVMNDGKKGFFRRITAFFLLFFSYVYYAAYRTIRFLYEAKIFKTYAPDLKVVSVGNITVGGTGKTPAVMKICEIYAGNGKRPAVLTRGYGEDEKFMLKDKLAGVPVLAGRDRIETAKECARRRGSDVIILDDGFQHWRLKRDLDIVLISAANPFGNGKLIPRGVLREGPDALGRADIIIITMADYPADLSFIGEEIRRFAKDRCVTAKARHRPLHFSRLDSKDTVSLKEVAGKNAAILCAVACPGYFSHIVKGLGVSLSGEFIFEDHHAYTVGELDAIHSNTAGCDYVITTAKDAVKIKDKETPLRGRILCLETEFDITENAEKVIDRLVSVLRG
jgi:tetraacyldisaccharide 4'-kinase